MVGLAHAERIARLRHVVHGPARDPGSGRGALAYDPSRHVHVVPSAEHRMAWEYIYTFLKLAVGGP